MSQNSSRDDTNRGQNALQRRALQLKRWHELESQESLNQTNSSSPTKVQFSSATLFLSSVAQNDINECERLLRTSTSLDVNATTGDGLTALHQMSIDDNLEMVKWLLRHGADVNCRDNEGWTPLHAAASCGHIEVVRLLLSRDDCDVFAINCDGELARDVCDGDDSLRLIDDRMRQQLDIRTTDDISEDVLNECRAQELKQIENDFKDFLSKEALNSRSVSDYIERTRDPVSRATLIHVCSAKGYDSTLEMILEAIGDHLSIDSLLDCDGFTPLHSSAFWRQISCFEMLLKFGANFDLKTGDSREIADLCHENPKIMELISETRKSREEKQRDDRTTLMTTAETQRRLNAKRQRETRRPTQGVTREDVELALRTTKETTEDTSPETTPDVPPELPSSPPPVVSLVAPSANCVSTTVSVPLYPQRRRPKRRSTGIDGTEVAPTAGQDCVDANVSLFIADDRRRPLMSSFGYLRSSANPRSTAATRGGRQPSSSSLSRSLSQLPFNNSQMPFITTAPIHSSIQTTHRRQPHLNRRQSGPVSSANSRLRSSSQSNLSNLSTLSFSSTPSSQTILPLPQTRSRSSSRQSSIQTTDDESEVQHKDDTRRQQTTSSSPQELDYKKLYFELLKENEFLLKKIKEMELRKPEDFQRERRQLLRRVSELEEELKQKEEIQRENARLKDENSALIRVISKLSK